jgi:hypothetical protein
VDSKTYFEGNSMADVVNDSSAHPRLSKEIVSAVVNDMELRALRPGSDEYKAAFEKKFPNKSTPKTASAPVTNSEPVETKGSETKTEPSDTTSDDTEIVPSKRAQSRIDKLVKERNLEKAENAKLAARVAELEGKGKPVVKPAETAPPSNEPVYDKPKPKIGEFKNLEEYQDAFTDWKLEKRDFEREQKAKTVEAQGKMTKTFETFFEKGAELEKELGVDSGDFKLVVTAEDFRISDPARDAILESPFSAQIAFDLASNDTEKTNFNKMTPAQQVKYVGRLEAKFEAKAAEVKETKTISSSRAPGRPLPKGTQSPVPQGFNFRKGMSVKEYEAQRTAQRKAR